jgi:hypothetical protein
MNNSDLTQPRAVDIEHDKDSLTVFASVHDLERRRTHGVLRGSRAGLYARLDVSLNCGARPIVHHMSRLEGEPAWVVDGMFAANGMPRHVNGFGARCLTVRGVAPQLDELLSQAARAQGLAAEIGPGVPLVLADEPAVN